MVPAVATTYHDPASSKRRLLRQLRTHRAAAALTQKDVAEALDWSASKVVRIESGTVNVSTTDLRALIQAYGVDDAATVDDLVALAKDAKRQSPWADFRDAISPQARTLFEFESSASIIRSYDPNLLPGLLQTEEYARALLADAFEFSEDKIERQVEARFRRQEILDREDPPKMFFIIDEAAIRRKIGGPVVMQRQLERLEQLASEPFISIQIMPFEVGAHPGLLGQFTLLEFPDPGEDNVLYLESRIELVTRDSTDETAKYLDTFFLMERKAARSHELSSLLFPS